MGFFVLFFLLTLSGFLLKDGGVQQINNRTLHLTSIERSGAQAAGDYLCEVPAETGNRTMGGK